MRLLLTEIGLLTIKIQQSCCGKSIINNKLLLEIMEVREEIEDASCDKELRPLLQSCQVKQNELCEQLAAAFREERIDEAKYLTAQLQYWYRVEETIMDKISSVH